MHTLRLAGALFPVLRDLPWFLLQTHLFLILLGLIYRVYGPMFLPSLGCLICSILAAPMMGGRGEGTQRHLRVFSLFLYLFDPSFEAVVQLGRMVFVKIVSILGYRRYYLEFRAFLGILPQG